MDRYHSIVYMKDALLWQVYNKKAVIAVCAKRKSSLSSNNLLQEDTQGYQLLFSSSLSKIYGSKMIYNRIIHMTTI